MLHDSCDASQWRKLKASTSILTALSHYMLHLQSSGIICDCIAAWHNIIVQHKCIS